MPKKPKTTFQLIAQVEGYRAAADFLRARSVGLTEVQMGEYCHIAEGLENTARVLDAVVGQRLVKEASRDVSPKAIVLGDEEARMRCDENNEHGHVPHASEFCR